MADPEDIPLPDDHPMEFLALHEDDGNGPDIDSLADLCVLSWLLLEPWYEASWYPPDFNPTVDSIIEQASRFRRAMSMVLKTAEWSCLFATNALSLCDASQNGTLSANQLADILSDMDQLANDSHQRTLAAQALLRRVCNQLAETSQKLQYDVNQAEKNRQSWKSEEDWHPWQYNSYREGLVTLPDSLSVHTLLHAAQRSNSGEGGLVRNAASRSLDFIISSLERTSDTIAQLVNHLGAFGDICNRLKTRIRALRKQAFQIDLNERNPLVASTVHDHWEERRVQYVSYEIRLRAIYDNFSQLPLTRAPPSKRQESALHRSESDTGVKATPHTWATFFQPLLRDADPHNESRRPAQDPVVLVQEVSPLVPPQQPITVVVQSQTQATPSSASLSLASSGRSYSPEPSAIESEVLEPLSSHHYDDYDHHSGLQSPSLIALADRPSSRRQASVSDYARLRREHSPSYSPHRTDRSRSYSPRRRDRSRSYSLRRREYIRSHSPRQRSYSRSRSSGRRTPSYSPGSHVSYIPSPDHGLFRRRSRSRSIQADTSRARRINDSLVSVTAPPLPSSSVFHEQQLPSAVLWDNFSARRTRRARNFKSASITRTPTAPASIPSQAILAAASRRRTPQRIDSIVERSRSRSPARSHIPARDDPHARSQRRHHRRRGRRALSPPPAVKSRDHSWSLVENDAPWEVVNAPPMGGQQLPRQQKRRVEFPERFNIVDPHRSHLIESGGRYIPESSLPVGRLDGPVASVSCPQCGYAIPDYRHVRPIDGQEPDIRRSSFIGRFFNFMTCRPKSAASHVYSDPSPSTRLDKKAPITKKAPNADQPHWNASSQAISGHPGVLPSQNGVEKEPLLSGSELPDPLLKAGAPSPLKHTLRRQSASIASSRSLEKKSNAKDPPGTQDTRPLSKAMISTAHQTTVPTPPTAFSFFSANDMSLAVTPRESAPPPHLEQITDSEIRHSSSSSSQPEHMGVIPGSSDSLESQSFHSFSSNSSDSSTTTSRSIEYNENHLGNNRTVVRSLSRPDIQKFAVVNKALLTANYRSESSKFNHGLHEHVSNGRVNGYHPVTLPFPAVVDLTGQIRTVEEDLDSGGFAVIHLGEWKNGQIKCEVAIKLLRVLRRNDDGGVRLKKRLGREVRVWHRLDHPNIVKFHGISSHMGGRTAMIMPWYKNGNASNYLTTRKDDMRTKIMLVNDVAQGLIYLHTMDPPVVHGDLKANNILITDDGHAALSDFGLSQVLEETIGPTGLTTTNIAGSMRWQAPEVLCAEGSEDGHSTALTTASDVWSFSCTAYELLTGMIPYFQHRAAGPLVKAIMMSVKPVWEEDGSVLCEVPNTLRQVVETGWAFYPRDRPDIQQLADKLENMW